MMSKHKYAIGVAEGKAAGGCDSIFNTAQKTARLKKETFRPNPSAQKAADQLFAEYMTLHDYFGRGANGVMKRLKHFKASVWNK
jgi:L-ribulokinase